MSVRIVHCATTHRAGDPRIFWKECRTLAEAGYDVVYVVPHERDEVRHGVKIRAVAPPRSGKERLTRTVRAVYRRALDEGRDAIIHLHDSDLLIAGLRLKLRGRRVVYDSHEDTPKQMRYQHWIPRPFRPAASATAWTLERMAGTYFDGIVAAEPENARRYPSSKTALVRNFPIVEELAADDALPYLERPPLVAYVGSITRVRGLAEMLTALQMLRQEREVELLLAGPFHPATLRREVEGADGVHVTGYLPRKEVAHWLGRVRAGLVALYPEPKHIEAFPTKLFEYMAAGVPVVASDFPVWRRIVTKADCGILVDPLNPEAIADAVRTILDHPEDAAAMGDRGRAAVREHYDWSTEGERLLAFYRRLIGEGES